MPTSTSSEHFALLFTSQGEPVLRCLVFSPKTKTLKSVPLTGARAQRAAKSQAGRTFEALRALRAA